MSYTLNDLVNYNNVFSLDICNKIFECLNSHNWYFGHGSHVKNNRVVGIPFWRMDLKENEFFSKYLLNMIEEKTQQQYELYDVYANGHTFGTNGSFHVDWHDERGRTFLFYSNPKWSVEWGGKTVFDLGNDYYYNVPKPNSAILFPGQIPHAAEGTSRSFVGLRTTIAWKLILKDS